MGKMKEPIFFLPHFRYFDKSFIEMFLSSPLCFATILSNLLNLIGCHGYQKSSSQSHKGDEAETLQKYS